MTGIKIYRDHFTLEREIATGGFATIYQAEEAGSAQKIAIKVAHARKDNAFNETVYKEAELLAAFQHRGIVNLKKLPPMPGKTGEQTWANASVLRGRPAFFVMEYLSGGSLQQYIDHVKQLSGGEAAAIGLEVARALDHVHRRNVAHNDLKLENIVFREPVRKGLPFEPVLIDFGIATKANVQSGQGTLYIMSPEQLELSKDTMPPELRMAREDELDKTKVDVWGLGVVMYYLIAGQLPFKGRTAKGITSRILNDQPEPLVTHTKKSFSPYLEELILEGCLAKNPRYRLELLELGMALKKFSNGVTAQRSGPANRRRRFW
ncbi:MAG: serine/threonine-protein kinase [Chloroflexota bacterium]